MNNNSIDDNLYRTTETHMRRRKASAGRALSYACAPGPMLAGRSSIRI